MSDQPVYVVLNTHIKDPSVFRNYEKGLFPTLKKHGGRVIAFDDASQSLEAKKLEGRVAIVQFPSENAAKSWYNDPDYKELCKYRYDSSELQFLQIVRAVPAR